MTTLRHKETGEIYTIIGDSEGCFIIAKDTNFKSITIDELKNDYENLSKSIDYSKIWPLVQNYIQLNPTLNNLLCAFLRRNDEDYYCIGDFVWVRPEVIGLHWTNPLTKSGWRTDHHYISCIFKITDIVPNERGYEELRLTYPGKVMLPEYNGKLPHDLVFPMYLDRIQEDDAYYNVKRLDMPF